MKKLMMLICLLATLPLIGNCQIPSGYSGTITTSSDLAFRSFSATTTNGGFLVSSGTATTPWNIWNSSGLPQETRKDDGRGPTVQQVDASIRHIALKELAPKGYRELVKLVDLDSAATDEADMLQIIHDLDLRVYDFAKVDDYLYRKALKQGTHVRWVWKPLRAADLKNTSYESMKSVGIIYPKLYAQKVPARILQEVKMIMDRDPGAKFFISDYEVIKPDPFLMVTTGKLLEEGKVWIVDRWDEPTFDDVPDLRASR